MSRSRCLIATGQCCQGVGNGQKATGLFLILRVHVSVGQEPQALQIVHFDWPLLLTTPSNTMWQFPLAHT